MLTPTRQGWTGLDPLTPCLFWTPLGVVFGSDPGILRQAEFMCVIICPYCCARLPGVVPPLPPSQKKKRKKSINKVYGVRLRRAGLVGMDIDW